MDVVDLSCDCGALIGWEWSRDLFTGLSLAESDSMDVVELSCVIAGSELWLMAPVQGGGYHRYVTIERRSVPPVSPPVSPPSPLSSAIQCFTGFIECEMSKYYSLNLLRCNIDNI